MLASPTPVQDTCTQVCTATRQESTSATCLSSFLSSSPLLPAGKELKPWFTTSIGSPRLPSSHAPVQLPSVTLIAQRLSPWGTRGTHGAPLRGKKQCRASVGCERSPRTRPPTRFALREPQLQFQRGQTANIQRETSSTVNGSILNRQDKL